MTEQTEVQAEHSEAQGAGRRNRVSHAGTKVTVASKLPTALRLQLCVQRPHFEPVLGGGSRETTIAERSGDPVFINGTAKRLEEAPRCLVVDGYALTPGINKDFWDAWLKQNRDHPAVKNGLLHAYESESDIRSFAREHRDLRTGMEPLQGGDDPRAPRAKVKIADADNRRAA